MIKEAFMFAALLGTFGLNCAKQESTTPANRDLSSVAPVAQGDGVRLQPLSAGLVGLKVEKAQTQGVRSVLKAMGKILACRPQTAIVSHAFPARVAAIHVAIGDWVEQGQALITLESQDVGNAMSEYYKAVASHDLAKLNLDRERQLLAEGVGVKKNYVAAEGDFKIAEANLEATEKGLHVLGFSEKQVEEIRQTHRINAAITLYAPVTGKVVALNGVQGGIVDQATEILTIIDPRRLWADAEIYEKDVANVKIGQEVEVEVPAYPGEIFRGKTVYIADLVNVETRTITVRAELANDDHRLKPGMFADVTIVLNRDERMVVVPSAAILDHGGRKIIFVSNQDGFVRREIETKFVEGDMQPVVSGVAVGEEVVIEGNHELKSLLEQEVLTAAHVH